MAESVEYLVGFIYAVVYEDGRGGPLVIEGELLSFDDNRIEIKSPKGSVIIDEVTIARISRKE